MGAKAHAKAMAVKLKAMAVNAMASAAEGERR